MPNNPKIIKDGKIADNDWIIINEESELSDEQSIVSLDIWTSQKEDLKARKSLGLFLKNDQCISDIAEELEHFDVIAIDFPVFMDGRGFSLARLLRDRYGYQGEVRATGGVIRDQLCYLKRCGFNAFDMDESIDLEAALHSLNDFTESYQTSADQVTPLYRRRA